MGDLNALKLQKNKSMSGIIKIIILIFFLIGIGLFVLLWQSSSSSPVFNFVFGQENSLKMDEHKTKVNTLYQLGLNKKDGLEFTQTEIGKILNIDIPYGVRIDFGGFIKAVDLLGGIDVDVLESFN